MNKGKTVIWALPVQMLGFNIPDRQRSRQNKKGLIRTLMTRSFTVRKSLDLHKKQLGPMLVSRSGKKDLQLIQQNFFSSCFYQDLLIKYLLKLLYTFIQGYEKMEIVLKMDPKLTIQKEEQLTLRQFVTSVACGYDFNDLINESTKISQDGLSTTVPPMNINEQKDLHKMIEAYNNHIIDEAYKYREQYLKCLNQGRRQVPQQHRKLVGTIKQQMQDVWRYQKQLDIKDWVHKKDGKNYKIYTKHFQDTVAVLVDAQIQVPIQKFIFIINEFDLMKQFMPFMEQSKQVKNISRNNKIGHIVNNFPIISKRQAFFQGIGYDRMEHNNSMLIYSRSLHNRPDLQQKYDYKVVTDLNAIQLQYKFFTIQYRPINRNKGKIKIAMNVDMHISAPKFILDPITQNFGKDFLKNVLHITQNFKGSSWQKKSNQKKEFMDFIRSAINRYFPN